MCGPCFGRSGREYHRLSCLDDLGDLHLRHARHATFHLPRSGWSRLSAASCHKRLAGASSWPIETANVLIADFARNLEDRISTSARTAGNVAQPARRINVLAVLLEAVRTRIRILFGRQT
jgi:hypothetical protein